MLISKSLNSVAWAIRKKSASKFNCPVLEISWSECMALAKKYSIEEECDELRQKYLRENGRNSEPIMKEYIRKSGRRVDHLQPKCMKEIKRVIDYFSNKSGFAIPMIPVDFKKKGKGAGTFYAGKNKISLHEGLLLQERENYIKRTPIHEAVHYCEFFLFGSTGHSQRWRCMMMEVGADPTRCHRYNVSKFGVKKPYVYFCDCRRHYFSQIQHERAQRRGTYWCTSCKNTIIFKEKENETNNRN